MEYKVFAFFSLHYLALDNPFYLNIKILKKTKSLSISKIGVNFMTKIHENFTNPVFLFCTSRILMLASPKSWINQIICYFAFDSTFDLRNLLCLGFAHYYILTSFDTRLISFFFRSICGPVDRKRVNLVSILPNLKFILPITMSL